MLLIEGLQAIAWYLFASIIVKLAAVKLSGTRLGSALAFAA